MEPDKATVWERIERPATAPRAVLSHAQIAAAAVELADAEGLDAVSMRKLAGRLGVAAMALYRYVSSKEELLELMVDAVHADCGPLPDDPAVIGDWRKILRGMALQNRARILRHPWLPKATTQALTALTPNQLAGAQLVLTALEPLGLDADTAMAVVDTVADYTHGATGREVTLSQIMQREGWQSPDDLRDAYAPHMIYLMSTGRYPAFHRWVREAKRKDDAQWRFEFGLDCLLDGIAARLDLDTGS